MTQQLFLVVGGELESLEGTTFRDPKAVHVVGVFPKDEAVRRWRGAAQQTVDNAIMRYFVVPTGLGGSVA